MNTATTQQIATTPHMERIHVTPELAAEWLTKNKPGETNRPLRKPYVRELRRDLEEGRWDDNTHQGIAFDPAGHLIDGQHRLTAISEAGIPVWMWVSFNVPASTFKVIDQHLKRTGGQILAMSGVTKDAPRLVAMARAILSVVHGHAKASNTEAAEFVVAHQTELELFLAVSRQYTPAVGAAFAWCAILGWPEVMDASDRLLSTLWADPAESDPMRALHNRARNFSDLGAGSAGIKARFDIALNCLEAVHEGRGLRVAKSYRPDYGRLERESLNAPKHTEETVVVTKPRASKVEQPPVPTYLTRYVGPADEEHPEATRNYDEEFYPSPAPTQPSGDAELDAAIEAEVTKTRRSRKSPHASE